MKYAVIVRAKAEGDIEDAALWYERQRPGLGDEFLSSVQEAISRAAANPLTFQRVRQKPEVRRVRTHRFPYRLFFLCRVDSIEIICVLHDRRHDREWQSRLPS